MSTSLLAKRLSELYVSHPEVYGTTSLTGDIKESNGKHEAKSFLVKKPLDLAVWEGHITGRKSIGCVPIRPNSTVRWGAIDIDLYEDTFSVEDLNAKLAKHDLPFVVCRSKSGGAHVYLFTESDVLAGAMVSKLKEFAAFFGQGTTEIFPKQSKIGTRNDDSQYGNWLNMPYDGPESLRVAQNSANDFMELDEFLTYAESRRLSPSAFKALKVPEFADEVLPDGPPCLNYILGERSELSEMRNDTMFNVAVYLKKTSPDNIEANLQRVNKKFGDPLPEKEVSNIAKSIERSDYRYTCSKIPLCNYCNSKLCKQKKYGVGVKDFIPDNRTLVQLKTVPPIWFLTIDGVEISLSSEQLDTFILFNRRVMEVTRTQFPIVKQSEWHEQKALLLKNSTDIDIPKEMTPIGQLIEIVCNYKNTASENRDDLLKGVPFKDVSGDLILRMNDLKAYVEQEKFRELKPNEVLGVIKQNLRATKYELRKGGVSVRCWRIPAEVMETTPDPDNIEVVANEIF